ncbi:OmpA family protein [Tahibacter harae]|uniref:OmpA family protein n=1 Tax=Tahibacter harae TaxID=2963937 RepID=A0ABT1QYH9_9GAMM|nr:OmpA family protein [Tahibacter harae]MCQ4167328.1 OmpA family protein [Tahibacter harae]
MNAFARAALALLMLSTAADAAVPGSDHALVGRYEGAELVGYSASEYDEVEVIHEPIGGSQRGPAVPGWLKLEGKVHLYYYKLPQGRSSLEVLRNYQASLEAKGFRSIFVCATADASCYVNIPGRSNANTAPYDFALALDAAPELPRLDGDFIRNYFDLNARYLLARRDGADGADGVVHASIAIAEDKDRGNLAIVRVIESKPLQQDRIRFIGADVMRRDIQNTGKVDLYGIQFDFDRATIRPESRPTLDEVARLLRDDPALQLTVAGHTDAQGDAAYNLDLSRRRAAAVVQALVRDYAVDSARLLARGAGAAEPLASNEDEAGRQKNRRVELARQR